MCDTPGTMGKKRSLCTGLLAVIESAPNVRPWNAPTKPMKRFLPECHRASFMAASTASAPLLE